MYKCFLTKVPITGLPGRSSCGWLAELLFFFVFTVCPQANTHSSVFLWRHRHTTPNPQSVTICFPLVYSYPASSPPYQNVPQLTYDGPAWSRIRAPHLTCNWSKYPLTLPSSSWAIIITATLTSISKVSNRMLYAAHGRGKHWITAMVQYQMLTKLCPPPTPPLDLADHHTILMALAYSPVIWRIKELTQEIKTPESILTLQGLSEATGGTASFLPLTTLSKLTL